MIFARRFSLNQRLLIDISLVSLLFWIIIATVTVYDDIEEVNELYDVHLAYTAMALLRVIDTGDGSSPNDTPKINPALSERLFARWPDLPEPANVTNLPIPDGSLRSMNVLHGKKIHFQAYGKNETLLYQSEKATTSLLTDKLGFSESTDAQGQQWRHYSMWNFPQKVRVVVSESRHQRNQLVVNLAHRSVAPLALGLPFLILLLWLSIKRALRPLSDLRQDIASRKPHCLTPLAADDVPKEVQPVIFALNELLQDMSQSMESERRFTDNAAHELRTPLAAIQAQLYALRGAANDNERQSAMDQLGSSVKRGICLVSQLLTLSRLEPDQDMFDKEPLNVADLVQTVCAELAPSALKKNQTLELHVDEALPPIQGNAALISMLVCNLIDNAIRYTGRAGNVSVALRRGYLGVQLEVADDGPGIPKAEHQRVFGRFYRLAAQDQPGTGLGLAICRRIAEVHFANIALSGGLSACGVSVRVDFPDWTFSGIQFHRRRTTQRRKS